MTLTITDAHGNQVTEASTFCARCGAHIKHVYFHQGKPYGSECIEVVTGVGRDHWVLRNGNELDIQASQQREAEAERKRQERIQAQEELARKREAIRDGNKAKFARLINVLNNVSHYPGDFCSEMARTIGNDGFSTNLYDILSPGQFRIVREVWGKTLGGRMNSKAYNAAVAEFDTLFDEE